MKSSWIAPFIDGLQSVFSLSGAVKGVISSSVSDGVESGFQRISPHLVKLFLISGLLLTGLLVLALGVSMALENALHVAGLGYLLTGSAFLGTGALYYAFNR